MNQSEKTPPCSHGEKCNGKCRWGWKIVRIFIVLALIAGAFHIGTRIGYQYGKDPSLFPAHHPAYVSTNPNTPQSMNTKNNNPQTPEEIRSLITGKTYKSMTVELRPQEDRTGSGKIAPFYITREFGFEDGDKFSGKIRSYADALGKIPLVEFEFIGHVEWQGAHPVVDGAQEIDYVLDRGFKVTPLNDQFAAMLSQVPVDGLETWKTGVTQDILGKAFPLFNIQKGQIVKDYDLIYIRDGLLYMGAKHVDGRGFDKPENRPELLQIPLEQVQ